MAEGVASTGLQWRVHEELITGFSSLVCCLTSDQLYSKIVPVLFRNISGKVGLVKNTPFYHLMYIHAYHFLPLVPLASHPFSTPSSLPLSISPSLSPSLSPKCVRPVKLASCHSLISITRHLRRSEQRTAICERLIKGMYTHMCTQSMQHLYIVGKGGWNMEYVVDVLAYSLLISASLKQLLSPGIAGCLVPP